MRLRLGWTQKDLALASGLTQSAIGNYESGQREPSGQALVRLANALKVTPEWLNDGEGSGAGGKRPKDLKNLTDSSGMRWPFKDVSFEEYLSLSASEKKTLGSMVSAYIQACRKPK